MKILTFIIDALLWPEQLSSRQRRYLRCEALERLAPPRPRLRPRNWVLVDGKTVKTKGRGLDAFLPQPEESK